MVRWLWCALLLACPAPTPEPTPVPPWPEPEPRPKTVWDGGVLMVGSISTGDFVKNPPEYRLERGFQGGGGRHIFVSYLVTNSFVGDLKVSARVTRARDGAFVAISQRTLPFEAAPDGGFASAIPHQVVLCPPPAGVGILGEPLVMESWAELVEGSPPLGGQQAQFTVTCTDCGVDCGG